MKYYLVTGAAGFIGSAVAKKLMEEGNKVVTIDNLSTGYESNIPDGVEFILGNCQNEEIIKKLYDYKFDAILHIAGQSSGEISFDNPVYDLQTNAQSTLLLLKYARENKCKKFIYASTMSVYGDQPDKPVNENAIPLPKSFYGVGKLASENYMRIFRNYGINSTALRLFNVYGPGQNMENMRQGMVSIFLAQALNSDSIQVKGSNNRFRDFIYIDDVVDAFICILAHEQVDFNIFNIATGIKTTVKELLSVILDNLPGKVSIKYEGSTPGDQFGITADISKIKKELGWYPKSSLQDGIKNMINWALKLK